MFVISSLQDSAQCDSRGGEYPRSGNYLFRRKRRGCRRAGDVAREERPRRLQLRHVNHLLDHHQLLFLFNNVHLYPERWFHYKCADLSASWNYPLHISALRKSVYPTNRPDTRWYLFYTKSISCSLSSILCELNHYNTTSECTP